MEEHQISEYILTKILHGNNLKLSEGKIERLFQYVELLLEWNKKINLISRKDVENVWERHILASLSILFKLTFAARSNIIDVGTGGGIPGIPLAIALHDSNFTLIDSIQKKIRAVDDMLSKLNLNNVITIIGRAETLSLQKGLNQNFDYVISRAVGSMIDIITYAKPFLRQNDGTLEGEKATIPQGSIIFFKGGDVRQEIETVKTTMKPQSIIALPLYVKGIDFSLFSDKKIVIVYP